MSKKEEKVSFSQQLLKFTNPKPKQAEFDPEEPAWDSGKFGYTEEDHETSSSFQNAPIRGKMSSTVQNMGKKYVGQKVSRRDLDGFDVESGFLNTPKKLNQQKPPSSESEIDSDEPLDFSDGDEMVPMSQDEDEEIQDDEEIESDEFADFDDISDEQMDDLDDVFERESDLSQEESDDQNRKKRKRGPSDLDDLEIKESEISTGVEIKQDQLKKELEKAKATKIQRQLWDSFLDLRISIQTAIDLSNRLPQTDCFHDLFDVAKSSTYGDKINNVSAESSKQIHFLLNDLVVLQNHLLKCNSETSGLAVNQPLFEGPVDLDSLWDSIEAADQKFSVHHNDVIDKWNTKMLYNSKAGQNKFKSFNQSILNQVDNIMSGQALTKITERSQLRDRNLHVIGKPDDKGVAQEKRADVIPDVEIYDDTDFYQSLIKDLVQSGLVNTDDPIGMTQQYLKLRQLKKRKHAKAVDTKASKGRKVRYEAHQKLASFMASDPDFYPESGSSMAEALFGSLLGIKHNEL